MTRFCNMGHHERVIRVGVGLLLLAIGGFSIVTEWANLLALGVGMIALLTGILGYCPAWHLFGISTCSSKVPRHHPEEEHPHPQADTR